MHRVVGERMGLDLRLEIDHKDRNGLNNQRLNLRSATDKQQKENQRTYKNNTSGYRGVCWEKGKSKWRAKIQHNGKLIHLGYFDTSKDASIIYEKKRKELFTRHGESNA